MFLLDYLFILLLGVNTGIITAYLMEGLYGNTMMTIDFSNVPVYMVAVIAGGFLAAIAKYLFDEFKENKKTGKIDTTTTDTKVKVEKLDEKLDSRADRLEKRADRLEQQADNRFQMQFSKLDNIDKFVAESRVLKNASGGQGIDVMQILASIQAMAETIAEVQNKAATMEHNLKEQISSLEMENQKLKSENQKYREEFQRIRNSRVQDEPER
ncbi:hypothetical protein [[Clostridium] symbiosum]|uniref:hypothetical protein n=1 Tax=Clostridium symbiosum TaxID=1512 RepID=UPI00232C641A|nr:hypothetical protein [[Clostridium] symbiosum]MDB2007853.1 hypothetical protein [[Clostridium] symbiosum]MDB2027406.1 hypothetical protein [[Clostridium] symbiosum]